MPSPKMTPEQQQAYDEALRRIQFVGNEGHELDLSRLDLTCIPSEIGQLTGLRKLWASNNRIAALPPEVGQLQELEILVLGNNQLDSLPAEIGSLQALESLSLNSNSLTSLPPEIGELKSLTSLNVDRNELITLPSKIGNLASLSFLNLERNQLTALPPEIGQLASLDNLDLQANQLKALPSEFGHLASLVHLNLGANQLEMLPPEFCGLTSLFTLHLEKNKLATLPSKIADLSKLKELFLHDNPGLGLPKGVLGPSNEDVICYSKTPKAPKEIFAYYYSKQAKPASHKATLDSPIESGEAWTDAVLAELQELSVESRAACLALLSHCAKATSAKPSERWLKLAAAAVDNVGAAEFKNFALKWFPLVKLPRTGDSLHSADAIKGGLIITPKHQNVLRGLAWTCGIMADHDSMRELANLAFEMFKKVPNVGPRAAKVGNACVNSLAMAGEVEAVGQLARLKAKVKARPAQNAISKALNTAAEQKGLTPEELEEIAVPEYGLTEVGCQVITLSEYTGELVIAQSRVEIRWQRADGKVLKALPAAVKKEFKAEAKEFSVMKKDLENMVTAQATRIETLFRHPRIWPLQTWEKRYLNHRLVGTQARRLIWNFTTDGVTTAGLWRDGVITDQSGQPVTLDATATTVELWHPLDQAPDTVLDWRVALDEAQLVQPFKQAHREVYILTEAERETSTYSNRFAGHLLRQHQFLALARDRGWRYQLMGNFDSCNTPELQLPSLDLRVEFDVGVQITVDEVSIASIYLFVDTGQVRMMRDKAPIALSEVPPLLFSEIMRDIDLFVGVSSVSNDPEWATDRLNESERTFWHDKAFGDLSAFAKTRFELLQTIIPKLKIAARCSLAGKFLVVQGELRTYKIHLGSGNILMSPNDQYLCITPSIGGVIPRNLFLPFEGDHTLSIILSKAFLLAADKKITDPSITSQISG